MTPFTNKIWSGRFLLRYPMVEKFMLKSTLWPRERPTERFLIYRVYLTPSLMCSKNSFGFSGSTIPLLIDHSSIPRYVVLQSAPGHSLTQIAAQGSNHLEYLGAICEALSAIHKLGVIHCDIKPGSFTCTRSFLLTYPFFFFFFKKTRPCLRYRGRRCHDYRL